MADIFSIGVALVAGLVSFLSPCVLPIIPGFLAYLSGTSLDKPKGNEKFVIFLNSIFFVLGFSVVFAILGVLLNSILSAVAYNVEIWLSRIGGAIIIFFGLYLVGVIRISYLAREHKVLVKHRFKYKFITSFVFGAAFAAGWTPCVGAALGAILGLAATQPGAAFSLLFAYSVGLGIPFLLVGAFASQADSFISRYSVAFSHVNKVFGIILIILGILVFTQSINLIANFDLLNKFLLR